MKDSYVILDEYSTPEGYYYIEINTHLGSFCGDTMPDEIDAQYPSEYHASEIALAKALRKFAEAALARTKSEIKLIQSMIKQSIDFAFDAADIDNTSFRILNGTLKQKQKDVTMWEARIAALTDKIVKRVASRDQMVAKYIKKGQN